MLKNRTIIALVMCSLMILLTGCSPMFKRIEFNKNYSLGTDMPVYADENTDLAVNVEKDNLSLKKPVYKITKKTISNDDYQKVLKEFQSDDVVHTMGGLISENEIHLYKSSKDVKEKIDLSESGLMDLETRAWNLFNKLSFLEGEYIYKGITSRHSILLGDSDEAYVYRVGVSFQKVLDGTPIAGNEELFFEFDTTGITEIIVRCFEYRLIGTINMIPLETAQHKIRFPDKLIVDDLELPDFYFDESGQPVYYATERLKTVEINEVDLRYENQFNNGFTVLQPVYVFNGIGKYANGATLGYKAIVIAVP